MHNSPQINYLIPLKAAVFNLEKKNISKISKQKRFVGLQREQTELSEVLLIAFNLSLIQRVMEFALKYEGSACRHTHNRIQLRLLTVQKNNVCFHLSSRQHVTGVRTSKQWD